MAEQEKPVRRRVALKVIKLGMDTRQVVARFEAERQALALMEHPNIARVLDAGATDAGRPFFVMELVGGVKITDYCDQNHLPTRQRLDLFILVCRAIQHAHQKGVIHRDIKPSNVLVATQDGVPVPKVIDFGIAKAAQGRLTDQTLFTAFEQLLGTPAYMSPEQAQLGGQDVDTRSDIYSLGVLLYELLTGKTPFDTREMLAGGLDAMRRTIQDKEPARPSTRLSTMGRQELTVAAEYRQADAPKLIHLLRGDLDWIVMKCIEKDRARRYATATGLVADIERHLNQEPVMARPPSTRYKVQKFIRRNRIAATAATAVAIALVLGIAGSTWEAIHARRAEQEQRRLRVEAQAARQDATEKLWASYLAEARAIRLSGRSGRQFESLSVLRKAAAIRPSRALRNEAIGSMVLPDIQQVARKELAKTELSISLDPTFERYAVCQRNGIVSIRRVGDDVEVARLPEVAASAALNAWFTPDGKLLAVRYADGDCRLWNWAAAATSAPVAVVRSDSFAMGDRILATLDGTNIVFHDLASGKQLNTISPDVIAAPQSPAWFHFDPACQRLALFRTRAQTNVSILDVRSGQTLQTLQHPDYVYVAAWHPNGRDLAVSCANGTIYIWDSIKGEPVRSWRTESCVSVGFNRAGTLLASSGWDGYTRLWDFENGRQLISVYRTGNILGFDPDDLRLAISSWEGSAVEFFEVASGHGLRTLFEAPAAEMFSVGSGGPIVDPSGKLMAFGTPTGIALWDVQAAQEILSPGSYKEKALVGFEEKALVGFDAQGRNLFLTGTGGLFRCPITESADGFQRSLGKATLLSAECAVPNGCRMGRLSADGRICAVMGVNLCQFFRMDTFEKQAETGLQPGMRYSDISSNGLLFASGAWQRPGVKVWDVQTGALVKELPTHAEHDDGTATVAFSPDNRCLVAATTHDCRFWNVGSWSLARVIPQEPGNDFSPMLAFTRDGKILAGSYARNKVRLHDAATGQVLADLEAPDSRMITALTFNHDGTQLAVGESAGALRLWDLRQIRRRLAALDLDWNHPLPSETAPQAQAKHANAPDSGRN